jgi:hypothetical protein
MKVVAHAYPDIFNELVSLICQKQESMDTEAAT